MLIGVPASRWRLLSSVIFSPSCRSVLVIIDVK
jgi:hypothetical protein